MSRLNSFLTEHLDTMIAQDPDIQRHFTDSTGQRLEAKSPLYQTRKGVLEDALKTAYETRLQAYDKRTFFQKYLATPLRIAALPLYVFGAATLGLGLIAGAPLAAAVLPALGYTGWGAMSSAAADAVDYSSYARRGLLNLKGHATVGAKSAFGKVLGYIPLGTGLWDLYHGRRKFDVAAQEHLQPEIHDALSYAKGLFLDKVYSTTEKERTNVISLDRFRDRRYAPVELRKTG